MSHLFQCERCLVGNIHAIPLLYPIFMSKRHTILVPILAQTVFFLNRVIQTHGKLGISNTLMNITSCHFVFILSTNLLLMKEILKIPYY